MAGLQRPLELRTIRHGESVGNAARDAAELARLPLIDIHKRNADTPLSALDEHRSEAPRGRFPRLPPDHSPTALLTSPRRRAAQIAGIPWLQRA